MQKKWNVLIVPNSPGLNVRSFELSNQIIQKAAIVAASFFVISLIVFSCLVISWRHSKATRIQDLEAQIRGRDAQLSQLSQEFSTLKDLEEKLRTIAGLEPREHPQVNAMGGGQGGPSMDVNEPVYGGAYPAEFSEYSPSQVSLPDLALGASQLKGSFEQILEIFERERARISSVPSINPVSSQEGWISSGFGMRDDPITGVKRFHEGCDIAAPRNTPIIAPADAIVAYSGWGEGLGRMVQLEHGYGYTTRYGHAAQLIAKQGDMVKRGDVIAYVGSSGRSTGPHLHYEIRYNGALVNPYRYLVE